MSDDLEELRTRLKEGRGPRGGTPEALRREVLEVAERLRAAGGSYRATAKQLGLSAQTLLTWRRKRKKSDGALVAVRVSAPPTPGPIVRGPRGLSVEGMTPAEIAELWLRLS